MEYCKFLGKIPSSKDEDKHAPAIAWRHRSMKTMDKEVRYIIHFAAKMKREIEAEFLTAKANFLYGLYK